MSDLVKKIQDWAIWCHENCVKSEVQETLYEAADEIERLRQEYDQLQNRTSDQYEERQAEIERLEAALRTIARREGPNLTAHGRALFVLAALSDDSP